MTCPTALLAAAALVAAAASAPAQETITYSLSFVEVIAGSPDPGTPVTNPNGTLDPGEAARIQLTAIVSPGIGSPSTYTPPPAPGSGTIAGLGSIYFDLVGSGNNGGAGNWSGLTRAPGWGLGGTGSPTPLGDGIQAAQAGQFVLPGSTANSANPVENIWRGVWTPHSYSGNYRFSSAPAQAGPLQTSILIQYGVDPMGNPQYVGKWVAARYSSVQVLGVPSPATAAPVVVMGLACRRRRRP